MVKYTCEKCGRDFQQKGHYTRHTNKTNPCIQESKLNAIIEEKVKGAIEKKTKKQLGQYFTISNDLQQFVFDKVKHKNQLLLEPSFGAGHLLKKFLEKDPNYPITAYELDSTVKPIVTFNANQTVIYGDFTKQLITQKYKTIVGNPPFVKQRTGNLYIKFIDLCFNLLTDDGELVFIVPSDFIKLTSASALITKMAQVGSFTDFLFPHDESLFEEAAVDILVFRYEKGLLQKTTTLNNKTMLCNISNGIVTFSEKEIKGTALSTLFDVYVGLVSGKDEVYKNPMGNITILNDKDKLDKYIFVKTYPSNIVDIDAHLKLHKLQLLDRRIKKFNEKNWFEWGAPRNIKTIEQNLGKPCIYVRNMSRSQTVAFTDKVQYFGGSLLCLMPKHSTTPAQIKSTLEFLNTKDLQKDYIYSGRFKIGHKQVCNIILP